MHSVLVVEDCSPLRSQFKDVLDSLGLYSIHVRNGIYALRVLEEIIPELIISDIDVSCMLGVEFTALLKNNPQTWNIPTVLCSADYGFNDPDFVLRDKADALVHKPLITKELITVLQPYLPRLQSVQQQQIERRQRIHKRITNFRTEYRRRLAS
jgi:CheY-like chemotaxis protein